MDTSFMPIIAHVIVMISWLTTLGLVFGGCCRSVLRSCLKEVLLTISRSNAITLEQLIGSYPHAGSLITFSQFVVVAAFGLPLHLSWSHGFPTLRPRTVPLLPYVAQVLLFYAISTLNNAAFAYHIPISVHIVFRSGGLVISMILGWLVAGKRCLS